MYLGQIQNVINNVITLVSTMYEYIKSLHELLILPKYFKVASFTKRGSYRVPQVEPDTDPGIRFDGINKAAVGTRSRQPIADLTDTARARVGSKVTVNRNQSRTSTVLTN